MKFSNAPNKCTQNFHLGRYIIRYTVGNLVLQQRAGYTSQNENFEYGYPHSNALLLSCLKLEYCKPLKATRHSSKCDIINDVKLFPTVYCFDIIQSDMLYKGKCIRI